VLVAVALPVVPGATCPSAAGALGAAGLGPICQATSGATGAVASAASQLAGFGVGSVLDALGSWVSAGAVWLLAQIGNVLGSTTGVDLGASWFTAHYETMAALSGVVIVPLLLLGIVQSIYRQDASMLVRSVLLNVPLAILLTAVAVELVQLGLAVTDAMSAAVAHGAGLDSGHFMATVTSALTGPAAAGEPGVPTFVVFLGGVALVLGAVMVGWQCSRSLLSNLRSDTPTDRCRVPCPGSSPCSEARPGVRSSEPEPPNRGSKVRTSVRRRVLTHARRAAGAPRRSGPAPRAARPRGRPGHRGVEPYLARHSLWRRRDRARPAQARSG